MASRFAILSSNAQRCRFLENGIALCHSLKQRAALPPSAATMLRDLLDIYVAG